ncbi:DUF2624 family protein [Aquibacillus rhizosphaerae]|uniref:DUF2624 family protein n=1 Tax=Aquibacillus rhizosphaerae TaxID=3051431 RepID=A0ABT7L6N7_9BACI|nr:DUF2624 family protein [Aquibacillus sp. LR5S19]MDL4841526.1 DUF2624 family protein [Aquibacillus sp. LR5S19]
MNSFMQQMAVKKLKKISVDELLNYSKQYEIPLTKKQAQQITSYLGKTQLDPFEEKDRLQMFKKLAQLTDIKTAQKTQRLFSKLIKEYGVESWFK